MPLGLQALLSETGRLLTWDRTRQPRRVRSNSKSGL